MEQLTTYSVDYGLGIVRVPLHGIRKAVLSNRLKSVWDTLETEAHMIANAIVDRAITPSMDCGKSVEVHINAVDQRGSVCTDKGSNGVHIQPERAR